MVPGAQKEPGLLPECCSPVNISASADLAFVRRWEKGAELVLIISLFLLYPPNSCYSGKAIFLPVRDAAFLRLGEHHHLLTHSSQNPRNLFAMFELMLPPYTIPHGLCSLWEHC